VFHENLKQEKLEEPLHVKNPIGRVTNHLAENSLMILSGTDLNHLLSLYTDGALAQEILHTAKFKSNGNVRSYLEMKRLMENVFGTMETLEQ
jgi:hypothetical protein